MAKDREPIGDVTEEPGNEIKTNDSESEGLETDQSLPESEHKPETAETSEEDTARVDIVTGDKRMIVSAPVMEFEEFKSSFKAMMVALGNFIEVAGLEIGNDETSEKLSALSGKVEKLRGEVAAQEARVIDRMVTKDDFQSYKADNEEKIAQESEDYVRREEFNRFRQAIKDAV